MAAIGDRQLLARAGTALVLANLRFWPSIAPRVKAHLAYWEQQAHSIRSPTLQALALEKLKEEHFNAQVAATLATLAPRAHRQAVIEAIVAYQVMYDYLDGLTEQPNIDPLSSGGDLFQAFADAVSLDGPPCSGSYYDSLPFDDDGYLLTLATVVHNALETLPSSTAIHEAAKRAAARCAEAQLRAHAAAVLGTSQIETWAKTEASQMQLGWQEYLLGAASSVLAVHALIAAAAKQTSTEHAAAIDAAFISICALSTMLDSLVDYQRDLASGQASYLKYYENTRQLACGLTDATRHAVDRSRGLPHRAHYIMTLTGVAAYYLSATTASDHQTRQATKRLRADLMPLIAPTLAVMRSWRAAKHARSILKHRRRS